MYWTDQLNNADSLVGYHEVGVELLEQIEQPIDVSAPRWAQPEWRRVSTTRWRRRQPTRVVIFEPDSSPVITTGEAG